MYIMCTENVTHFVFMFRIDNMCDNLQTLSNIAKRTIFVFLLNKPNYNVYVLLNDSYFILSGKNLTECSSIKKLLQNIIY